MGFSWRHKFPGRASASEVLEDFVPSPCLSLSVSCPFSCLQASSAPQGSEKPLQLLFHSSCPRPRLSPSHSDPSSAGKVPGQCPLLSARAWASHVPPKGRTLAFPKCCGSCIPACSLFIPCLFPACSLFIPACSLFIPCLIPVYFLPVSFLFPACPLFIPCLFPAYFLSDPCLFPACFLPAPCPALPPKAAPEVQPGTVLLPGMLRAHPGRACRMLAMEKGSQGDPQGDPVLQRCRDRTHSPPGDSLAPHPISRGCLQQRIWKMRSVLTTSDVGTWSFSCLAGNSIPKDTEPKEGAQGPRVGGHLYFPLTPS